MCADAMERKLEIRTRNRTTSERPGSGRLGLERGTRSMVDSMDGVRRKHAPSCQAWTSC